MKKKFLILFLLLLFMIKTPAEISEETDGMTFSEAFEEVGRKPMLMLIYADWADNYLECIEKFRGLEPVFGNTFNFVELDIASEETKAFNAKFKIDQNLPYVLMFRDGGKISRYLDSQCLLNESCIISRLKSFIL